MLGSPPSWALLLCYICHRVKWSVSQAAKQTYMHFPMIAGIYTDKAFEKNRSKAKDRVEAAAGNRSSIPASVSRCLSVPAFSAVAQATAGADIMQEVLTTVTTMQTMRDRWVYFISKQGLSMQIATIRILWSVFYGR